MNITNVRRTDFYVEVGFTKKMSSLEVKKLKKQLPVQMKKWHHHGDSECAPANLGSNNI